MQKFAKADYPVHELISRRWSPQAFSGRAVDDATLRSLFEAARWAASSYNEQPWAFVVARREDKEAHGRLVDCLVESNRKWAAAAPVLVMSVARLQFERTGAENRHALHDVGAAVAQLSLQAAGMGLQIHQMAGIDGKRAQVALGIPDGCEAVAAIAIGYPGEPVQLSDDLRDRELSDRERRPQREFVFDGSWENAIAR